MAKRKKLVVANWKMNPQDPGEAKRIFLGLRKEAAKRPKVQTVICPPFIYLSQLRKFDAANVALGAQDIATEESGAYTGEVSAPMVHNMGARYVIIGHSERRAAGETDEVVAKKTLIAFEDDLVPIVCIGEKERDTHGTHLRFLEDQIRRSLGKIPKKYFSGLVVAYEPVWAIGKSAKEAMKPEDIEETTLFIKKILADIYGKEEGLQVAILYGGSVEPENAGAIIQKGGVDGFLVGHKSLHPEAFGKILQAAHEL